MASTETKPGGARAVEAVVRSLRLLECFEPGRPQMPLAEFVRKTGYSRTTTYRLLRTLEHAGWLERTPDAAFRLTVRPFQVGAILVDSLELRQEAGSIMTELAGRHEDTVYLMVPHDGHAVCLERIDGGSVRLLDLDVGGSIDLHLGAGPRALLAFSGEEEIARLLGRDLDRRTKLTITDAKRLRTALAEIRELGYAISAGDVTDGIGAVGAPVWDRSGRVVAALSISGLLEGYQGGRGEAVARDVVAAAGTLSARLGYLPPRAA